MSNNLPMITLAGFMGVGYSQQHVATFGENLKTIRERLGVSQGELAERLGAKQATVSNWENDKRGLPGTATLFRMATALGVTVEELVADVDPLYEEVKSQRGKVAVAAMGGLRRAADQVASLALEDKLDAGTAQTILEAMNDAVAAILFGFKHGAIVSGDLLRHAADQRSVPSGGADVPASIDVRTLTAQLEETRAALGRVQDVADVLLDVIAHFPSDVRSARSAPKSTRRAAND